MFASTHRKNDPVADSANRRQETAADKPDVSSVNSVWQSLALSPTKILPKLAISQPHDPLEQEADHIAEKVMNMGPLKSDLAISASSSAPNKAHRMCSDCDEEEQNNLLRKAEASSADSPATPQPIVGSTLNSRGKPLDDATRSFMEERFDDDFSRVRVHTDSAAAASARSLGALAYTVGNHIAFRDGTYEPGTGASRKLIAHELAHVVQQRQSERHAVHRQTAAATPGAAADPLTEAVRVVRLGTTTGATLITTGLVSGIRSAEAMFLRESPLDRWAESLGFAGTVGPGQLGEPAINDVDSHFATESAAFQTSFGAPPATWQAKATDANWSYFYVAAYLVDCINRAERTFQPATPVLTSVQIGVLELGIALYHGAFDTIRALRRRIAANRHIGPEAVTIDMVNEELRSVNATPEERELEKYTQLARGYFDFTFNITAAHQSRRFWIGEGKVRITCNAAYQSPTPSSSTPRANHYLIRLHRFEVVSGGGGAVAEGTHWYTQVSYNIGAAGVHEWTDLPRGDYMFKVEKDEDPYSPDVLIGTGRVETTY